MGVILALGRRKVSLKTEDVSLTGMFLRTDDPPVGRRLVRVDLSLPPEGTPVSLNGMVAHVIPPGHPSGRAPGVGIQLYANSREVLEAWGQFILHVREGHGRDRRSGEWAMSTAASGGSADDPVQRKFARREGKLEVRFRTVDELLIMYTRDVSSGGMLLVSKQPADGETLSLGVIHPETDTEFRIRCVVRRQVRGRDAYQIGVEFLDMDLARRQEFWEFVSAGIQAISDDDVVAEDEISTE